MGWYTEIIVIAENIKSSKDASEIQKHLYHKDSKRYGVETCYLISQNGNYALYYHYERRKYAPYWAVQTISEEFPGVRFTILGSMLDFLCGPGGLLRISKGEIEDSYGVWPFDARRSTILNTPLANKEVIYEWFGADGQEHEHRKKYVSQFPYGWCETNYVDKIIPIPDDELVALIERTEGRTMNGTWSELEKLQMIPDYETYQELLRKTPLKEQMIEEESFMSFMAYHEAVIALEKEVAASCDGEIVKWPTLVIYDNTFGPRARDREWLRGKFKTIQDIADCYQEERASILQYARTLYAQKNGPQIVQGASFRWLLQVLKTAI